MEQQLLEQILSSLKSLEAGQEATNKRLDGLEAGQKALEAGQKALEDGQKVLEDGQKVLEDGQKVLEDGQKALEAGQKALEDGQRALEDELKVSRREARDLFESVNKNIGAIAEQHIEIVRRLDAMVDYPITKGRLATVEQVVKDHTRKIQKLEDKAV